MDLTANTPDWASNPISLGQAVSVALGAADSTPIGEVMTLRVIVVSAVAVAVAVSTAIMAGTGNASARPASGVLCFGVTTWSFGSGGPSRPETISSCVRTGPTMVPALRIKTVQITGYPTIGRLFFKSRASGRERNGNCTATVLNGTSGKSRGLLVLTAGHCVRIAVAGVAHTDFGDEFVPGWEHGKFPHGEWSVQRVLVDSSWITCHGGRSCRQDPACDFAILVLRPRRGVSVTEAIGAADGWRVTAPSTVPGSWIFGYPSVNPRLLLSRTTARTVVEDGATYRVANTPQFTDGTSGGPWFSSYDRSAGTGIIYGEIGGYQEGGYHPTPSYSAFWGPNFAAVVAAAVKFEGRG
jgi:hypothetical protein